MLPIVLFAGSCSTKRVTAEAHRQATAQSEQTAHAESSTRVETTVTTVTLRAGNEEIVTVIREYDTDKTADPVTGKPPLKRESEQTYKSNVQERQEQSAGQTVEESAAAESTVTINIAEEETAKAIEKRGLSLWQQMLCSVGSLTLLALLVWAAWKLFKRKFKII